MHNLTINSYRVEGIDPLLKNKLKDLCYNVTNDDLIMFDTDEIIVCRYNGIPIAMCNIAFKSPNKHFENEKEKIVPYLYNYIRDPNYQEQKASLHMMNYIKRYLYANNFNKINLNTSITNERAQRFFKKNNFVECGIFANEFLMLSCSLI